MPKNLTASEIRNRSADPHGHVQKAEAHIMEPIVDGLKAIVDKLAKQAEDQVDRAYRILGATPGPGVDLLIYPVQPINGMWIVTGLTKAGRNFVGKFWSAQPFHEINRLKSEANDWQLKYKIEYPVLSLEDDK